MLHLVAKGSSSVIVEGTRPFTAWEDYCDGERSLANAIKRLGKV